MVHNSIPLITFYEISISLLGRKNELNLIGFLQGELLDVVGKTSYRNFIIFVWINFYTSSNPLCEIPISLLVPHKFTTI